MIRHIPNHPPHDAWVTCESCGGTWLGQFTDACEWCREYETNQRIDDVQRILFPEFLNWGDAYISLKASQREVWERTRGFGRDFIVAWQDRICDAVESEYITQIQADNAMGRFEKWQTLMNESENE